MRKILSCWSQGEETANMNGGLGAINRWEAVCRIGANAYTNARLRIRYMAMVAMGEHNTAEELLGPSFSGDDTVVGTFILVALG
jgi:hypothetical protein